MIPWAILVVFTSVLVWVFEGRNAMKYGIEDAGAAVEGENVVSMPTQVHVVLGGTLSFLVVFRTNTAYSKWAEARQAWGDVSSTSRAVAARLPCAMQQEAIIPGASSPLTRCSHRAACGDQLPLPRFAQL